MKRVTVVVVSIDKWSFSPPQAKIFWGVFEVTRNKSSQFSVSNETAKSLKR